MKISPSSCFLPYIFPILPSIIVDSHPSPENLELDFSQPHYNKISYETDGISHFVKFWNCCGETTLNPAKSNFLKLSLSFKQFSPSKLPQNFVRGIVISEKKNSFLELFLFLSFRILTVPIKFYNIEIWEDKMKKMGMPFSISPTPSFLFSSSANLNLVGFF